MLVLILIALLAAPGGAAAAEPAPRVLVTGDSMVHPLDEQMTRPVRRAGGRTFRDPRPGTGITKPLVLDWVRHARRQARRKRPTATVVFLGAHDWNRLRSEDGPEVECCRRAWIDAYAGRVGQMMRAYQRRAGARVYWLTLPTPRESDDARRNAAVNAAIAQAADAGGERVRLVDTVPVLSPGNRFRRRLRYRDRTVVVRDRDGIHLTEAGSRIARDLVVRAMRRDGAL